MDIKKAFDNVNFWTLFHNLLDDNIDHKCMKMFLGYSRRDSITQILLITGLPSFTTILHNAKQVFKQCIESCPNSLILMFNSLQAGCVGCM